MTAPGTPDRTEDDLVEIPTDDGAMPAHLWATTSAERPTGGTAPVIVLFQEIFGVSAYIKQRAGDLAELGYTVVAPEIYWRLDDADIDESQPDLLPRAMGVAGRLDWDRAVRDAAAAVAWAQERADKVGLVGFCFGGGLAFAAAAATNPDALVSYYGSALPQLLDQAGDVTVPSLHHFGEADSYFPIEVVEQIRAALDRPGVEFHTYPGADHAFDNPNPMFHSAEAAPVAWERTVDFLARVLPVSA